jgi:allantoinase
VLRRGGEGRGPRGRRRHLAGQVRVRGHRVLAGRRLQRGPPPGLPYHRVAELVAFNPARRYGLLDKGDIDVGYDADLALLDPDRRFVVRAAESASAQGYTPFEGQELTGRVTATFLRGALAWEDGAVVGPARGRYVARPSGARRAP